MWFLVYILLLRTPIIIDALDICQLVKLSHFEPNKIQNGRQNVLKMKKIKEYF